jgi:8-oxo-dGTP pyrophosphatase MutT (NUDIX family)
MRRLTHSGIYGLVETSGLLLTVRKTRGPYRGLLDVPGGASEAGDVDMTATLRRELLEETGRELLSVGPWHKFSFTVTRDSSGNPIDFVHAGHWTCAVLHPSVAGAQTTPAPSADTDGTIWVPRSGWQNQTDFSPLLRTILAAADHLPGS